MTLTQATYTSSIYKTHTNTKQLPTQRQTHTEKITAEDTSCVSAVTAPPPLAFELTFPPWHNI